MMVMTLFWLISLSAMRVPTMASLCKYCVFVGLGDRTRGVSSGVMLDEASILWFMGWVMLDEASILWFVGWDGCGESIGQRGYVVVMEWFALRLCDEVSSEEVVVSDVGRK
jgi:hypothetical protein